MNIFRKTSIKIASVSILGLALTWLIINVLSNHSIEYSVTTVSRQNLIESVSATGSVTPNQNVMLTFNMQGRVANIAVDVGSTTRSGEVLASLDTGTLQAQLSGARADVIAAQAKLAQIQRGARPEELIIYEQKYRDTSAALASAMKSAYLSMEDAVVNKADSLFINGDSVNPTINVRTQSVQEKNSIQDKRIHLRDQLQVLKDSLSVFNPSAGGLIATSTFESARKITNDTLSLSKDYLDSLGAIASNLSTGNSGQSQDAIDRERAIVNAAGQEVSGAITAEQSADALWSASRDSLALERAGSTSEDIQVTQAAYDKAVAIVSGLESQLKQATIVSPFDGVVTAMNIKIGEVYVPGISGNAGIGLMSQNAYKVELYVPETDVTKIHPGDSATVTFDAYGPSVVLPATVYMVDPAETMQNGVKSYKISVTFDDPSDSRIKSGLTTNVRIDTNNALDVLVVPARAIITRGADKFVLVKDQKTGRFAEQKIQTGIVGNNSLVEIVSGLNEGDIIANFGSK